MGSVYAGGYLVGGSTVNRYPIRLRANGSGTATLNKYGGGWSQTYSFTNALSSTDWQEISAFIDVPVGQTWTIKIQYGGTQTLSTNMPGRLTINDLILTEGPSYAPVGQSVTNMTWFALTNDVVGLSVLPGPYWVTNSPTATADLFDWVMNGEQIATPTDLTHRFSPTLGTNTVEVSCHTPNYIPIHQGTEVEGCVLNVAVDANRDNYIQFDGSDTTTTERPYRFWVNDGRDGLYNETDWNGYATNSFTIPVQDALDPSTVVPNHTDVIINGTRDLENFARVSIHLEGASLIEAVASNAVTIGMAWRPLFSDDDQAGWDPTGSDGNPKINLFALAPIHNDPFPTGGRQYLDDVETGIDQAKVLQLGTVQFGYGYSKGSVAKGEPLAFSPVFYFENFQDMGTFPIPSVEHPNLYMLFEGASRGRGRLGVILGSSEIDPGATNLYSFVHIDLRNVKELYERWTVGDGPSSVIGNSGGGNPAGEATISTARLPAGVVGLAYQDDYGVHDGLNDPDSPDDGKYILYVHGYNMKPWEKDAFAEAMLKRLYWSGYKGRFGAFQWPCTYGTIGKLMYDDSEFTAWKTAIPLQAKLQQLRAIWGPTYVMAHSQGNVALGEALRINAQGQQPIVGDPIPPVELIRCYVASQAAIPVHCYDPSKQQPDNYFNTVRTVAAGWYGDINLTPAGPETPNIYPDWMRIQAAGRRVNFYNQNDWALSRWVWETDQALKPNSFVGGSFCFEGNINTTPPEDGFWKGSPDWPISLSLGSASEVADRYEIMSFAAEPRCRALGTTAGIADFQSHLNLQTAWGGVDFNGRDFSDHCWHSAQFRFSYAEQKAYWDQLLGDAGFGLK
jgi:hypothetical protein